MKKNDIKIKLISKDIKNDETISGTLIDKVAIACGQWTEDDLYQNNFEYEGESVDYVWNNFDYENAFLEWLNKNENEVKRLEGFDQSKLKAGAFLAIHYPSEFADRQKEYQEKLNEARYSSEEAIAELSPELAKKCEEAQDQFWKQLRKEWLFGDYREWAGMDKELARKVGAMKADYIEATDTMFLTYSFDEAREFIEDKEGISEGRITASRLKQDIVDWIEDNQQYNMTKEREENKKRVDECKRLNEYKAQQAKDAATERKAKLLKMTR